MDFQASDRKSRVNRYLVDVDCIIIRHHPTRRTAVCTSTGFPHVANFSRDQVLALDAAVAIMRPSHQPGQPLDTRSSAQIIGVRRYQHWLLTISAMACWLTGAMQFFIFCAASEVEPLPRREMIKRRRLTWRKFIGTTASEWALAGTLRGLAGGSIYEVMDGPHMGKSTAYACIKYTLAAILGCRKLRVKSPRTPEELDRAALGFRGRGAVDVMKYCVAAADALLVRWKKPSAREHAAPDRFYSGHKKAEGSGHDLAGNARHRLQDRGVLHEHTGEHERSAGLGLCAVRRARGLYSVALLCRRRRSVRAVGEDASSLPGHSRAWRSNRRSASWSALGGILWRPLEVPLKRTGLVMRSIVRLHHFLRDCRSLPPAMASQPFMSEDVSLLDNAWAPPVVPARRAAGVSLARDNIRLAIAAEGLTRPEHNLTRNRAWRVPTDSPDDVEISG